MFFFLFLIKLHFITSKPYNFLLKLISFFQFKPQDTNSLLLSHADRAFRFGDCIFDTILFRDNLFHFAEDHYLRLVASMRIVKINIPDFFTPDFFYEQLIKIVEENNLKDNLCRIRTTVWRENNLDDIYFPKKNEPIFMMEISNINEVKYDKAINIGIYRENWRATSIINTIKTNNSMINNLAGICALEQGFDNVVFLNQNRNICCATNANIFIVEKDNKVITPPIEEGCVRGVVRKNILKILKNRKVNFQEKAISPFEIIKAKEIFITNSIKNIQSVGTYKDTTFETDFTQKIKSELQDSYAKNSLSL